MSLDERVRGGLAALKAGDPQRARQLLSAAASAGRCDASSLLALASACVSLRDTAGQMRALDLLLRAEPTNVRALIMKGDHFASVGDTRAASSHYLSALRAAPGPEQLSTELAADLRRASKACEGYAEQYRSHVVSQMKAKGFDPARSSSRFAQSLDIALGKKRVYLQQPKYYYFPGLPQIQFYDRSEFPWLRDLESAANDIRDELLQVLIEPDAFAPYVQGDPKRPHHEQGGMLNNPAWSAFYLCKNGVQLRDNAQRCPRTLEALRNAPLAEVPERSPSILFSLLRPGAHIPPHHGFVNTRLICHLPLIVPPGCTFRVGNDVRSWETGKAWVFDDTIEHEAWNASAETRVILLFDIWRPELTTEERRLVSDLFQTIDAYDGNMPQWAI